MKKIYILVYLFCCFNASAQIYYHDDINEPHTTCVGPPVGFYYPDNPFPQWRWGYTHGSPSSNGNSIFMWHETYIGDDGEGVFLNYHFAKNTKYEIIFGFSDITGLDLTYPPINTFGPPGGNIVAKLMPGQYNNNGLCPVSAGDTVPAFSGAFSLFSSLFTTTTPNAKIVVDFKTPNQDFESIVIHPISNITAFMEFQINLDCITIIGKCPDGKITYDNIIDFGDISKSIINIGSSLGTSTNLVNNSAAGYSHLIATDEINIVHNTLILPYKDYFLAEIEPCKGQYQIGNIFKDETKFTTTPFVTTTNESPCIISDKATSGRLNSTNKIRHDESFAVSPNPTTGLLHVQCPDNKTYQINIYNLYSKRVVTMQTTATDNQIDLSKLPRGLYIVEIIDNENNKVLKKVTLE